MKMHYLKFFLWGSMFTIPRYSCQKHRIVICFLCLFFTVINLPGQPPPIQWQKALGGSIYDFAISIEQTTDGGYIVAGISNSIDGDVSGNHGDQDFWIVKLAATGNIQWQRCLGGSGPDYANSIEQTTDGGYIVAGFTLSNNGDVSGNHGDYDFWIVKLDATGNIQWQRCLGGSDLDAASSIEQTTDGGYIVAGQSYSNDGDVSGNHGGDYWIVKLDATGNIQWQRCLGGSDWDYASSIQQTTDGGYIVAGATRSNDGDVSGWHVGYDNDGNPFPDCWVVKLDNAGTFQWQKCLGGTGDDAGTIYQTADGSYMVAGGTSSNDGDVSGNHGDYDYWIVKLAATGNIQWQKCLGGSGGDYAGPIQQTTDGGYIVAGYTYSNNGDVSGNHGGGDAWIVKLDATGNIQQRCLGGSNVDIAGSIEQTTDGGYIVAGHTESNDGDVSGNHGGGDAWIVKLGFNPLPIKLTSITVRNRGNVNIINWSSASEDPGESYELQRSADAVRFSAIASLPGNGHAADYEYTDTDPIPGVNYYRLLLINNDGNNTFSKIVKAFVKTGIVLRLSPNPANEILTIQIRGSVVSKASVQITDVTGKTVLLNNLINNEPKKINISMLAPGVYFLRYRDDQHEIVKKFVVN